MSLPFSSSCNIGGDSILPSEISLVTALGSGGSSTSTTFKVNGSSLFVLGVLASGQTTLKAKLGASDPVDMGSGTTDITLVGAGSKNFIRLDSSSTNVFGRVSNTDANWSSALSQLDIFVLSQKPADKDFYWFTTDSMENGGAVVVSSLPR